MHYFNMKTPRTSPTLTIRLPISKEKFHLYTQNCAITNHPGHPSSAGRKQQRPACLKRALSLFLPRPADRPAYFEANKGKPVHIQRPQGCYSPLLQC